MRVGLWIARLVTSYLVILWSALFLYGAVGTIHGRFPLSRAIPAGAFLLLFIGLFGFSACHLFRKKI